MGKITPSPPSFHIWSPIVRSRSVSQPEATSEEEIIAKALTSDLEVVEASSTSELEVAEASTLQQEEITEASTPQLEEIITEDAILCNILSFLSLSEAVRSSVLSSRWRRIWTGLTKFDFDANIVVGAHTLTDYDLATKELYYLTTKRKTSKFIRIVNSIVRQLQRAGATLDTFAVHYFLDKRHSRYIDAWVRFALASKTRVLRLHLFRPYTDSPVKPYELECQLLGSSPSTETLSILFCNFKLPFEFNCFCHLKRLCISEVDATEEGFNCILSSCSTIMRLAVLNTPQWTTISVPHPLSQLQCLFIHACNQVRKIEINAINLSELKYSGAPVDFRFRQSTKLIEADICFETGGTIHGLDFYLTNLSSTLPHLQSLTLNITHVSKLNNLPKGSSIFIHLTCLNWEWNADIEMSLLHLITLLDVAPYLQQLKLRLLKRVLEQPPQAPTKFRELLSKHPHTHLKTVQVSGFYFDTWQIEVAAYLLNNATGLESMMIKTGSTVIGFDSEQKHEREIITEDIQERGIEILSPEVPANVRLVIL